MNFKKEYLMAYLRTLFYFQCSYRHLRYWKIIFSLNCFFRIFDLVQRFTKYIVKEKLYSANQKNRLQIKLNKCKQRVTRLQERYLKDNLSLCMYSTLLLRLATPCYALFFNPQCQHFSDSSALEYKIYVYLASYT